MCTDHGRAVLELADEAAPQHVANFLTYVDMGYYSGTVFHRVVPGFVVQGGGVDRQLRARSPLPPVANESRNGLQEHARHRRGGAHRRPRFRDARSSSSISRTTRRSTAATASPASRCSRRVTEGIEVFDAISRLPTGSAGPFRADVPTPLVAIKSIVRLDAAALAALPAEGREAALKAAIEAAAASGDAAEALRLVGHYRALCAPDDADIALTEARMALAADDRRRALFALEELLATTDASLPAYEAATAFYREALTEPAATPQAVGGCAPPAVPQLPDAAVATEDEMVASQRQVREFVLAGEAHLACLAEVIDDDERGADERNAAVGEHNRMVAAMEEIAAAFNERIRIFRARG